MKELQLFIIARLSAYQIEDGKGGGVYLQVNPNKPANSIPNTKEEILHRLNMELALLSLFGLLCTAVLIGWDTTTPSPPSPRIWAHIRERYWSAKIDDISLLYWKWVELRRLPDGSLNGLAAEVVGLGGDLDVVLHPRPALHNNMSAFAI